MTEKEERAAQPSPRPRKAPRRITRDYLHRAALHYIERYSAPSAQLRRVLARKIALSCRHHGDDPASHTELLEDVVARCQSLGLVDDRRFAEARAASLHRKGLSGRAVAGRLAAKGVARELIAEVSRPDADAELDAARTAARRKRLGPWRRTGRAEARNKDLAALARLGFGYAIARQAIDEELQHEPI